MIRAGPWVCVVAMIAVSLAPPTARDVRGDGAGRQPLEVFADVSVGPHHPGQIDFDAGFRETLARDYLPLEPRWRQRWDGPSDSLANPYVLASMRPGRIPVRVEVRTEPEAVGMVSQALPELVSLAHAEGTIPVPIPRVVFDPPPHPPHVAVEVRLPFGARHWWTSGRHRQSFTFEAVGPGASRRAGEVFAMLVLEALLRESRALPGEQQLALGPGTERDTEFRGHARTLPLATALDVIGPLLDREGVFAVIALLSAAALLLLRRRRNRSG